MFNRDKAYVYACGDPRIGLQLISNEETNYRLIQGHNIMAFCASFKQFLWNPNLIEPR